MTSWMIDTSALAQRSNPAVRRRLEVCIDEGAAVCDMVVAESLIRARSAKDFAARNRFFAVMEVAPVDQAIWTMVRSFAEQLAAAAKQVAAGDAVIAACASVNELAVLHYDSDYETLGAVCAVEHSWVVDQGTL